MASQSSASVLGYKSWRSSPVGAGEPPSDSSPPPLTPLTRVVIGDEAADTGVVGASYTFTATANFPTTGTINLPITYTWQATDQSPVVEARESVKSTAAFTWTTGGSKAITVTAENADGSVVTSHTITIDAGWRVYLPMVVRD